MWILYQQLPDGIRCHEKVPPYLSTSQVYLVTGGFNDDRDAISSTEIFKLGDESWTQVGNLPLPAVGIRGASINNKIFMTGDLSSTSIVRMDIQVSNLLEFGKKTKLKKIQE